MANNKEKTYLEKIKNRIYNNKTIAIIILAGIILTSVLTFYEKVELFFSNYIISSNTAISFKISDQELKYTPKVIIKKGHEKMKVLDFNKNVIADGKIEHGTYTIYLELENKEILFRSITIDRGTDNEFPIIIDLRFTVNGEVRDAKRNMKPISNVTVLIDGQKMVTKDDGKFILSALSMKKMYEISAFLDSSVAKYNRNHPWRGTVYNGNWDSNIIYNVILSR